MNKVKQGETHNKQISKKEAEEAFKRVRAYEQAVQAWRNMKK